MDLGFATHGVHMDQRLVYLKHEVSSDGKTVKVTGPPHSGIYPPGPAWIYFNVNGVPSVAQHTMIGDGASPPVDVGASEK
jgi:hypothetical protein